MSATSETAARRRQEAHALYQAGHTQKQIAAALGVSQKRVSEYLAGTAETARRQKERPPRRIQPETGARIEQALRLNAAGLPQHEIARQMSVTQACVSIWLKLGEKAPSSASEAKKGRRRERRVRYLYRRLLSEEQQEALAALVLAEARAAWTARRLAAVALEHYGVRCSERSAHRMLRQWFARQEQEP